MSAFSDHAEDLIINMLLRGQSYTGAAQVYLGLYESNPGEADTGQETQYTDYQRQEIIFLPFQSGFTRNSNNIQFPANNNASASVTITHAAVFDGGNIGANMLLYGQLQGTGKILQRNDVLAFAPNALSMGLD